MSQAEEMLGLRGGGLARWMRRHGIRPKRVGKYRVVSLAQLDRYEALTERAGIDRAAARPRGWVGIYQAAELVGVSVSSIWTWAGRREIEAVRVGHVQYYNPESVQAWAAGLRQMAPFGWAPLVDTCGKADIASAARWLRRQGHEVRKFTRPSTGQRILHARAVALEAWHAYHVSQTSRKLSSEQAAEIRERRAAGEKRNALAREYGVSEAAIYQIMQGKTYRSAA